MMALLVITGNVDRAGGQLPGPHTYMERYCGFETREEHFMEERYPHDAPKAVGAERFPLWYDLRHDMQANDLTDNILRQDENSVKVLFALGMNYRMFPQDGRLGRGLRQAGFLCGCGSVPHRYRQVCRYCAACLHLHGAGRIQVLSRRLCLVYQSGGEPWRIQVRL